MVAVTVRAARPTDVAAIHAFVVALARHQGGAEYVTGTPAMLAAALFGPDPPTEALVAELHGEPVGVALFHRSFSSWECVPGLWLEDLFVTERARGSGAGRSLVAALAQLTVERGYTRLEWHAAAWNTPALGFYRALGAGLHGDQRLHRLTGARLRALAAGA